MPGEPSSETTLPLGRAARSRPAVVRIARYMLAWSSAFSAAPTAAPTASAAATPTAGASSRSRGSASRLVRSTAPDQPSTSHANIPAGDAHQSV